MVRIAKAYHERESLEFISRTDPITREVIAHRLWQINAEQGQTLVRTTGALCAAESHDFNSAIGNARGEVVCVGPYIFMHMAALTTIMKNALTFFPEDEICEGDMYITNDSYMGGLHQQDYNLVAPVHWDDKVIAWVGCLIHEEDPGGPVAGGYCPDAYSVFEEAPRWRFLKVVAAGKPSREVIETISMNTRLPEIMELNLRGQIAAANVAKERIFKLCEKYGFDTVQAVMEDIIDYSDSRLRNLIIKLPDGEWYGESHCDNDGHEERLYTFKVTLKKQGDKLSFDFSHSSEQSPGFINLTDNITLSCAFCAVSSLIGGDIDWNEGLLKPLEIITERGTINDAQFPAPVSNPAHWICLMACISAVGKMLSCSEELKDRVMGAWMYTYMILTLAAIDQRGKPSVHFTTDVRLGGGGARYGYDGVNNGGTQTMVYPLVSNVESTEQRHPILVVLRKKVVDSGGPGIFRGGTSAQYVITPYDTEVMEANYATWGFDHTEAKSFNGGLPGAGTTGILITNTDLWQCFKSSNPPADFEEISGERTVLPGKGKQYMHLGDCFVCIMPGGGSIGDPIERDAYSVARDVREGNVSPEWAKKAYRVVLNSMTGEPDLEKTRLLREQTKQIRMKRGRQILPTPGSLALVSPRGDSTQQRLGENLYAENGVVYCRHCNKAISKASENPKLYCLFLKENLGVAGPWIAAQNAGKSKYFQFWEYICPGCGSMLSIDVRLRKEKNHWDDLKIESLRNT